MFKSFKECLEVEGEVDEENEYKMVGLPSVRVRISCPQNSNALPCIFRGPDLFYLTH